ncbi:NYN domain-containing protein [Candidatus Gottesmanbacteria bacterium]|nr:NYN domain-containing protein [Candidatus Gottesmanbacteria bacterium]
MSIGKRKVCFAFIDAANLFYGGEKSLGWSIDYRKLLHYLKEKFKVTKAFYYAGVELNDFPYSVLDPKPINLDKLLRYLNSKHKLQDSRNPQLLKVKQRQRAKFYRKLKQFGYTLRLKPTKIFIEYGHQVKKANCDVDMTFELMRYMEQYQEAVILSGDGDFVVVLKYLMSMKRKIYILARAERTARDIRQLVGDKFMDFTRLRHKLEFSR